MNYFLSMVGRILEDKKPTKLKSKLADLEIVVGQPEAPITVKDRTPHITFEEPTMDQLAKLNQHAAAIQALGGDIDLSHITYADTEEELDREVQAAVGHAPLPEPEITFLPTVIQREMERTGGRVHPNWYPVKRLPGYARTAIRTMGKEVFSPFTNTPIDDIHVLSSLTNSESELKYTAIWIRKHGKKVDKAHLDFEGKLPGYEADLEVWDVSGYQFALVEDFMGVYIYGWIPKGKRKYFDPKQKKYLK